MLTELLLCYLSLLLLFINVNLSEARPPTIKHSSQNSPEFLTTENKHTNNLPKEELPFVNKTKTRILNRGGYVDEFAEQDIVFPDRIRVVFEPLPKIDGKPKCAGSQTFCEDFHAYPYNEIQDVLKRSYIRKDMFGKDDDIVINNRIGDESDETFLCASNVKTVFPKVGINKNNEWKYIINQADGDGYIQGVKIETCSRKDAPCDIIGELPNGYTTRCKQKFILRRMMSLSEGGQPVPDAFKLPSACCCIYKKDVVGFFSRFGDSPTSPSAKR